MEDKRTINVKKEVTEYLDDDFLSSLEEENNKLKRTTSQNIELLEIEDDIEILTTSNPKEEKKFKIDDDNPTEILDLEPLSTLLNNDDDIEELELDYDFFAIPKIEVTTNQQNIEEEKQSEIKTTNNEQEVEKFEQTTEILENTLELKNINIKTTPTEIKKKTKIKKGPWFILLGASTLVITLVVYEFFFWQQDSFKTNKQIESIVETTGIKELQNDMNINVGLPSAPISINVPFLEVDFNNLIKQNQDVQGWIKVKNTNINYPFVQTTDNQFYLKHSFNKNPNSAGWVFADFRNNIKEWDQNTILYAHGRLDNTMFGSLKKVVEEEWYEQKENHWIQISTKTSNSIWQVFSVYTIKPETYYITPNFENKEEHQEFLDTLIKRSDYNFDVELNTNNKIITLSSCYNKELRVVLHAKLIKEEPR